MTIDKLPSGSYRIREQVDGKRYTLTVPYKPTKREAARLIQEKVDRQATPTGRLTMQKAVTDYIEARAASRSPSTLAGYDVIVKSLPEWLLRTYVADMSQAKMQRYTDELLTGSSDRTGRRYTVKTIRNRTGFLVSVLKEVRPELTIRISLPVNPKKDIHIPEDDDVQRILAEAKGTKYEVALTLAAMGLRRSEICAAKLEDLTGNDLHVCRSVVRDRESVYVTKDYGKTSASSRHVYLPDNVVQIIQEQGYIYKGSPDSIASWLRRAETRTGVKSFSLHKLRHYFASQAHSMGIPDAYILQMGGWSTTTVMTTVYRHAQEQQALSEQERFAEHISGLVDGKSS